MNLNKKRILIISKNSTDLVNFIDLLKNDYEINTTSNYDATLLAVDMWKPMLIVCDVLMLDELYSLFLEKDLNGKIAIVFYGRKLNLKTKQRAYLAGAIDIIQIEEIGNMFLQNIRNKIQFISNNFLLNEESNKKDYMFEDRKMAIMDSLALISGIRDPYATMHNERCVEYAKILICELKRHEKYKNKLNRKQTNAIIMAVPIHDIGKVAIPEDILMKKKDLTEDEISIMKLHTAYGKNIVDALNFDTESCELIKAARDIVYYHHEDYDGKGYPLGLRGEEIPLSAQIMRLIDSYDNITNSKMYTPAYPHELAVDYIIGKRGICFSDELVTAFLEVESEFAKLL